MDCWHGRKCPHRIGILNEKRHSGEIFHAPLGAWHPRMDEMVNHINWLALKSPSDPWKFRLIKEGVFLTKPESSFFKTFWMPDQVRHDGMTDLMDRHFLLMKVFFLILVSIFGSLSCEKAPQKKLKSNSPPIITSVEITPKNPNQESDLDVTIRSQDPDGDPVTYLYQWIKNNEEIPEENKNILKKGNFKKSDLIQVKVTPSDGKMDGTPFLSQPVEILNSPPVIQEVRIEPKMAYASDTLTIEIKSIDVDRDSVDYTYRWEKNGVVLPEETKRVLESGQLKKGDVIAVTVTPNDGKSQGVPKKSESITILNSSPNITSSPSTSVQANEYIYQVKAIDPDNDPITFALKSAPKGMEINKDTGLIRWSFRSQDSGTHPVEIEAFDKDGAKCFQRFVLSVEFR